eukprot:scaffold115596_cov36-Phaeocystis_antarctica.AAC.3
MAPNSLTSAPTRSRRSLLSRWLSSVVFPAPRKPVTTETGKGRDGAAMGPGKGLSSYSLSV